MMRIFPPWPMYHLLQKELGRCWFPSGAPQVGHDSNLLFTFLIGGGDGIAWRQMFVRYLKNKHPPTTELMCPRLVSFHNYYFYPYKEPTTCYRRRGSPSALSTPTKPNLLGQHPQRQKVSVFAAVAFDVGSVTRKSGSRCCTTYSGGWWSPALYVCTLPTSTSIISVDHHWMDRILVMFLRIEWTGYM